MNGLEQELIAVTGVSRAHVDVTEGNGATLHVELDDDADRESVAAAVDVVLRRHGLRSRARSAQDQHEQEQPGHEHEQETPGSVLEQLEQPEPESGPEPGVSDPVRVVGLASGIDEVVIGHRSGRMTVVVRTGDGHEASAGSVARPEAADQAVAAAVGKLLGLDVPPHIVEVRHQEVGSRRAVTVVLDIGDDIAIGTSFERGSGDLGLARAIWNALTGS